MLHTTTRGGPLNFRRTTARRRNHRTFRLRIYNMLWWWRWWNLATVRDFSPRATPNHLTKANVDRRRFLDNENVSSDHVLSSFYILFRSLLVTALKANVFGGGLYMCGLLFHSHGQSSPFYKLNPNFMFDRENGWIFQTLGMDKFK